LAEELEKFPRIKDPNHEIAFQLFVKRISIARTLDKRKQ